MENNKKESTEFRFYEKPSKEPVLALTGEGWNREYGEGPGQLHFHNMAEIGYCYNGKGQVVLHKESFDFTTGSVTFIPRNYPHTTNSDGYSQWGFFFFDAEEVILNAYQDNPGKCQKIMNAIREKAFVRSPQEDTFLGNLALMIFNLMDKKGNLYKDTIHGALYTTLLQIAHTAGGNQQTQRMEGSSNIVASLDYISYHYQEDIRISELAACCHLSETHFRRMFQRYMSMTPVEYLNLTRVQAACDLMRKGNSHMEEVAIKVGYQTMSTFNRNFNRIIGSSPYQWKKQMDSESNKREDYHVRARKGWT